MKQSVRRKGRQTPFRAENEWGRVAGDKSSGQVIHFSIDTGPQNGAQRLPLDGAALAVQWNSALGATEVEFDTAPVLSIAPGVLTSYLGELALSNSGNRKVFNNPDNHRIGTLRFVNLKRSGNTTVLNNSGDFPGNTYLVVSAMEGEQWSPRFVVPNLPAKGELPGLYRGASYSNGRLSLPYGLSGKLRFALVEGSDPDAFNPLAMALDRIEAWTETLATDVEVRAPDGSTLWAFPGEWPKNAPQIGIDLSRPLKTALQAESLPAQTEGRPLRAHFAINGKAGGAVKVDFPNVRGSLIRREKLLSHVLEADPVALAFGTAPDPNAPNQANATISVRYMGLRLLGAYSDMPPAPGEAQSGMVLTGGAELRGALHPEALIQHDIARVAVIGRAPEQCELEIRLVRYNNGVAGAALGPPARISIAAATRMASHWAELPAPEATGEPAAIALKALSGRFFWAVKNGKALSRLVVRDPEPGGRSLHLGPSEILRVECAERFTLREHSLPVAAFGAAAHNLYSELFLNVEFSDLVLRYHR